MEVEQRVVQETHLQYLQLKVIMEVVHQVLVTKRQEVVAELPLLEQMAHKIQVPVAEEELEVMVEQEVVCQMPLELLEKVVDHIIIFQVVEQEDQMFIVVVVHQEEEDQEV